MKWTKRLLSFFAGGVTFTLLAGVVAYIVILQQRPALLPWHTINLHSEFKAGMAGVTSLNDYLRVEDQVMRELVSKLNTRKPDGKQSSLNRYNPGSRADPFAYPRNWNRTYEFVPATTRGGVLLLHGLSDSPYSMRSLALLMRDLGFYALVVRLPGHGTAPSGLVRVKWEDMTEATRIAARHVRDRVGPSAPVYIIGYSNGAALAVEYTLRALAEHQSGIPAGLVLLSPAIGVSPVAALAKWQSKLAAVPGMEKLAWSDLQPEFDPYKYNSFAVNAGDQIYELTTRIEELFDVLHGKPELDRFPPTIAFQSVVDATIPPHTLIDRLLRRLPAGPRELVWFDVNRHADVEPYLANDPGEYIRSLLEEPGLPFDITLVTNQSGSTQQLHAFHRRHNTSHVTTEPLELSWPRGIYSLSHVALPFAPDDPIYGATAPHDHNTIYLGRVELRGERGVLQVPAAQFARLRYNPFFSHLAQRVTAFVVETGPAAR